MSVFAEYAHYYDAFYDDKDYESEARFVLGILDRHAPGKKQILELGCGTGGHAEHLCRAGHDICGVDISQAMLDRFEQRCDSLPSDQRVRLECVQGDMRAVRLGREFDAVIAVFHVIGYQTTNSDVAAALATMHEHLAPGGVLVFDCWHGPAVLTERPEVRIKRRQIENVRLTRIAEPKSHIDKNQVDVRYTLFVNSDDSGVSRVLEETHEVRYFFVPEMQLFLEQAGFEFVGATEWLTGLPLSNASWGACFTALKK